MLTEGRTNASGSSNADLEARRGLWADQNPIPSQEWRDRKRVR